MPSLLAHLFLGMMLARVFRVKRRALLLFGAILPDIKVFLYAPATLLLGLSSANALIIPIHSPFGGLLLSVFFASLLRKGSMKESLWLLCLGVAAHFALDASIYPFYGIEHYLLLYPASWETYGIEASEYIYPFNVIALIAFTAMLLKETLTILKPKRQII